MPNMKIGLLGGSFDPIHRGHTQVAKAVSDRLGLDRLYFIPNAQSVDKKSLRAPAKARFEMCELASQEYERLNVSNFELAQQRTVYSIETIEHMQQAYPGAILYWIIGADRAHDFANWHQADKILEIANVVIYQRDDIILPNELLIANHNYPIDAINSETINSKHGRILAMGMHHQTIAISSTALRKSLLDNSSALSHYLSPAVIEYIHQHHLYNT